MWGWQSPNPFTDASLCVLVQIPSSLSRAPFTLVDHSIAPPVSHSMVFLAGPASIVQVRATPLAPRQRNKEEQCEQCTNACQAQYLFTVSSRSCSTPPPRPWSLSSPGQ
jgi:hypothetical protein